MAGRQPAPLMQSKSATCINTKEMQNNCVHSQQFSLAVSLHGHHRASWASTQGCSTLWNAEEVEEAIEATDGGAEAVLGK
jgi:hypothetical protein